MCVCVSRIFRKEKWCIKSFLLLIFNIHKMEIKDEKKFCRYVTNGKRKALYIFHILLHAVYRHTHTSACARASTSPYQRKEYEAQKQQQTKPFAAVRAHSNHFYSILHFGNSWITLLMFYYESIHSIWTEFVSEFNRTRKGWRTQQMGIRNVGES